MNISFGAVVRNERDNIRKVSSGRVLNTIGVQEMMAKTHFFKVTDFRNFNKYRSSRNSTGFQSKDRC